MMQFFETRMGKIFFESTMPRIAESLERLVGSKPKKLPRVETFMVTNSQDAAKDINEFLSKNANELVDVKESAVVIQGDIIREFLVIYIPKN